MPLISEDLDLSSLEEDLLTLLEAQELYGLEIIKAMQSATGGKRKIGYGSLYPTLHKLQKRGFLKARWGEDTPTERAGARRRYYRITAQGQEALNQTRKIRVKLVQWRPSLVTNMKGFWLLTMKNARGC